MSAVPEDAPSPPSQSDFPDLWTADCPDKGVKVEIQIGQNWIEIPTMETSTRITKGESASIQRGAKIRFPTPWGTADTGDLHTSPRRLINQYNGSGEQPRLLFCRISHDYSPPDEEGHQWVYTHFGWVGSVGMTGDDGVGKFWVYDVAELLQSVPINESWNDPPIEEVLKYLGRVSRQRAKIPLVGDIAVIAPDGDREFYTSLPNTADIGRGGLLFSWFAGGTTPSDIVGTLEEARDGPNEVGEAFGFSTIGTESGWRGLAGGGAKTFTSNHDTLQDVFNWFEKRTNSTLHFEPDPNGEGVRLVANINPSRRRFTQRAVAGQMLSYLDGTEDFIENLFSIAGVDTEVDIEAYETTDLVDVQKNTALVEAKPINTVTIRGGVVPREVIDEQVFAGIDGLTEGANYIVNEVAPESAQAASRRYPVVKVQVPALVDAAGGAELGPVIESDATSLQQCKKEARRELRERVEGATNGEIVLEGHPYISPYDLIDAFETCDDLVELQPRAVTYEVEDIEHVKNSDGLYDTNVRVSIDVSTSMEIVSATHQSDT